ncbi:PAS domain-containing sensor histidine kinase [Gracilimonas mengyeensis]|uniref:histidine kinase n=1 Tax=Gracilimonas mengyeensis TaxID=1302730 RepID=A0A521ERD9_9BACT|nr:PAS domain-containing sensor histidine kinase [Gracilimonas mengyeensis]SMO86503.1 PAS domain S-box-containing protein [Gracilimonas mengyeensis]
MMVRSSHFENSTASKNPQQLPDERLGLLIKNSFDLLVLLDEEGNQWYVSESSERILGYHPEELMGISVIDEMIHPDDREQAKQGLQKLVDGVINAGAQYRHKHKNGGWVYLEAYGNNQLDNPNINAIVLNVRDISERKAAEDRLRESEQRLSELNAAKDKLFSIIGHDLRNPFTIIIGLSELLVQNVEEEKLKDLPELAGTIRESALRINDLLSHLLTWAKAQSGRFSIDAEEIEITTLIQAVVQLFQESADQKFITLNIPLEAPRYIQADQQMVHTVLRNLLSNAIKFTPEGGSVTISVSEQENTLVISVKDTGIGISGNRLNQLFQIEHAHSNTGTKGEKGTGLGLLLCKEFVALHKGKIWAESTLGEGSTFSFSIPL